jgi:microcin C transport system permease protein
MRKILKSPLTKRRWQNFKSNRRAFWSLWIFGAIFILCLFAELIANDKPLLIKFKSELHSPAFKYYSEYYFGGDFKTEAIYQEMETQCLIKTGGLEICLDEPDETLNSLYNGSLTSSDGQITKGWMLWAPIPYSFDTINYDIDRAPSAPDRNHLLGTDDQTRDVIARINSCFI